MLQIEFTMNKTFITKKAILNSFYLFMETMFYHDDMPVSILRLDFKRESIKLEKNAKLSECLKVKCNEKYFNRYKRNETGRRRDSQTIFSKIRFAIF